MGTEKIIKSGHEKEIRTIFRKLIASGVLDSDKAITKIMRDFPHFFRQPSENEVKQTFNDVLNSEIRSRARQSNKLSIDIFSNVQPTDKTR
jgi:hypothetical protein